MPVGVWAQESIQTRAIPGTDERLPLVGLGSPDFFYTTPEGGNNDPAKAVIQAMYDAGGRLIDTPAFFRPDPPVLGPILQEMNLQDELFLVGKITRQAQGREAAIKRLNTTIENLGRKQIDLMMLHNIVDVENVWPVLQQAKEEGKVRYIGASEATDRIPNDVLEDFMRKHSPDFIMPSYSMFRPQIEERILPLAADMGTAVIAIEVFKTYDDGAYFSDTAGKELPEWASEFDCESWAQFALKFVLSHPAVTCTAVETSKTSHIIDNMAAAYGRLPDQATRKRMADHFYSLR
jgi:aryl-alcohol dehydrogenase-like predicted oxidoreductase